MRNPPEDSVTLDSKEYVYRSGFWTTPAGYRVCTSAGQVLTTTFHRKNGRLPSWPPPPPPSRARRR